MLSEFRNFLSSLNDVSNIVEYQDGTISFQYQGFTFLFAWSNDDPSYIRLMLPRIAELSSFESEEDALRAVDDYNKRYKTAKMCIFEENIWLLIEQFVYSRSRVRDLFARIIRVLISASRAFALQYISNRE